MSMPRCEWNLIHLRWKHVWHDNSASLTRRTPAPFTTSWVFVSWLPNANQEDISNPYSSSRSRRVPCNYGERGATEFQPAAAEFPRRMKFSPVLVFSLHLFFFTFPLLFSRTTLFWIERLHLISWSQQCCYYWFWTSAFMACLAWLSTLSLPRMPECEQEAWTNGTHQNPVLLSFLNVLPLFLCDKFLILLSVRVSLAESALVLLALIWSNSVSSKHRRENRPFHSWKKRLLILLLHLLDFGVLILSQQARSTFLVWATVSMTCQIHPTVDSEFLFLSKHGGFSPVSASYTWNPIGQLNNDTHDEGKYVLDRRPVLFLSTQIKKDWTAFHPWEDNS